MSIIVQKFGGTSVADTEKIKSAARKAIRSALAGHQVVVVVSAMGKTTDHLIAFANELTPSPSSREMDMLMSTGEQVTISLMAIALQSLGYKAVSMTGAQMGIITDSSHTKARIRSIAADKIKRMLDAGNIVIAAGFQGVDEDFQITTLGRGGSDTTAVALAAALGAEECEIYTDVDGVYTTDPRILPEARKVPRISYDEMLELASLGAGVMHSRSIEFAKKFGVTVHVRSSFSDTEGTLITRLPESPIAEVCGVAIAKNEARLTVLGVPDQPGAAMQLFSQLAEAKVATDMIVQNIASDGKTDISFTIPKGDLKVAQEVVQGVVLELNAEGVEVAENVAKVSAVGLGMARLTGVAQKIFQALADRHINIEMISTSDIKVSVLVPQEQGQEALKAIHEVFRLASAPAQPNEGEYPVDGGNEGVVIPNVEEGGQTLLEKVSQLAGMEDIIIDHVLLDQSQARITLSNVPDRPGLAAEVFKKVADAGILVDMIVQSVGRQHLASISFTVLRGKFEEALSLARVLSQSCKSSEPTYNQQVSKLSVFGTGLRSHTGLAYRMFKTMGDVGINVSIINTSEMCIDITVRDEDSSRGYAALCKEFGKETV
ncbi:MAG: aspartate kinase [Thermoguttaceae bacterium]